MNRKLIKLAKKTDYYKICMKHKKRKDIAKRLVRAVIEDPTNIKGVVKGWSTFEEVLRETEFLSGLFVWSRTKEEHFFWSECAFLVK